MRRTTCPRCAADLSEMVGRRCPACGFDAGVARDEPAARTTDTRMFDSGLAFGAGIAVVLLAIAAAAVYLGWWRP